MTMPPVPENTEKNTFNHIKGAVLSTFWVLQSPSCCQASSDWTIGTFIIVDGKQRQILIISGLIFDQLRVCLRNHKSWFAFMVVLSLKRAAEIM
jgi:hypothetical protein